MAKFDFTVEQMVEYGEQRLKEGNLIPDLEKFYKFTNAMLDFELGVDAAGKELVKTQPNVIKKIIAGGKMTAYAATGMRNYARTIARDLRIFRVHPLKCAVRPFIKQNEKYSLKGYYYRSGVRYLAAVGLR